MYNEILPVPVEQRKKDIGNIRRNLFPPLINHDHPTEFVLSLLHTFGTLQAPPTNFEQEVLEKKYIMFYAGEEVIMDGETSLDDQIEILKNSRKVDPFGYHLKGKYRILGCFRPNRKLARIVPETSEYFTAAVPVSTKDYRHEESQFYYPPVFNIHKQMAKIADNLDNRLLVAETDEQVAKAIADFYFLGVAIEHPFIGGNHRAFDRFMEYGFAKEGIIISTPLDETCNIPPNHPFNRALYAERRRILQEFGLNKQTFGNMETKQEVRNWLKYQASLNEAIDFCLNGQDVITDEMAEILLSWA